MEVCTEMEETVLFLDEEHWCFMWRMTWMDKSDMEMLIQKLMEFMEFGLQQGINHTRWMRCSIHKVDLKIIQSMWS